MKYIRFWLILLFIGTQGLQAQIKDKIVPHMGFTYEFVTLATPPVQGGEVTQSVRNFYTFNIGAYYAAFHKNDVVSIGIEPNVHAGFNLLNLGNKVVADYIIQTPVYLMGRLGANATPFNTQKFGIGAGIGGTYTIFSQQVTLQNRNKAQFFNPTAMVEVTIGSRGSTITGRAHFSLFDIQGKLNNTNGAAARDVNFSNWGLGIIYAF